MQGTTVYQRTEHGRAEIKNKSRGLTQSERQVLIMVDGTTSCDALAQKLMRLSAYRLQQILLKLVQQGLIAELLLPPETSISDNFDSAEVARFLHQDAWDPVTVISLDPEQDFDLTSPGAGGAVNTLPSLNLSSWVAQPVRATSLSVEKRDSPDSSQVDFYLPLGETYDATMNSLPAKPGILATRTHPNAPGATRAPINTKPPANKVSWEYWFIGLGILFIVLSLAAHYLR